MKILALVLSLLLTSCATYSALEPRPNEWAGVIKPDANFYQVDTNVYRSEQPIADDLPDIYAQNIKTVINLQYNNQDGDKRLFDDGTVKLVNEPIQAWHVRPIQIARVLYAIEQEKSRGGVLVHCRHGADRTGIIIAMYRVIYQDWEIETACAEMKQGGYGFHKIWQNIDNLLSPLGVEQVRGELNRLKSSGV